MLTNHTGDLNLNEINYPNRQVFGLGFALRQSLDKSPSFGSEGELGWGGAYHSVYWADPTEELAVVYFTQLIPANDLDDHKKLRNLVYQAIID